MQALTQDEFISRAKKVWGDRYNLSEVVYINRRSPIEIICPKHGRTKVNAGNFLDGCGCKRCGYEQNGIKYRMTKEQFLLKARKAHGWRYDYSLSEFDTVKDKITIICPEHGEFRQQAGHHLCGRGCPECGAIIGPNKKRYTKDEYITRAMNKHGDRYDYSLVEYKGCRDKIRVICREHGEFSIQPYLHLNGVGCPRCKSITIGNLKRSDKDAFVSKALEIHGDKYDYSKVKYIKALEKVEIVCKKHGSFWQTPASHLWGRGCPNCNSSKGENELMILLSKHHIAFIQQYKFDECKHKQSLPFDFYLPQNNICIEFQGKQHYQPIEVFGGEDTFEDTQLHDQIKRDYCASNRIKLIEIRYDRDIEQELKKHLNL